MYFKVPGTGVPARLNDLVVRAGNLHVYNFNFKCPGQELNLHAVRHTLLRRTCLPIPPPGHSLKKDLKEHQFSNHMSGSCLPIPRPNVPFGTGGHHPGIKKYANV